MRPVLLVMFTFLWFPGLAAAAEGPAPIAPPQRAPASELGSRSGFGERQSLGPTSTEAALLDGDRLLRPLFSLGAYDRMLKPYFDWKGRLNRRHGFKFGADYTALYQRLDDSPGEREAASGILRLFGEWTLLNRCRGCHQGALVWKVEYREKLRTAIAPNDLGFEIGYGGITGALFNDFKLVLTNLFWKQGFGGDRGSFAVGQVDALDWIDVSGLGDPWGAWQNLAVLVNQTIPIPNQGLGAALSWRFNRHLYLIAGFADANALPRRDFTQTWRRFETFKHAEFGWMGSADAFFQKNVHVTLWQVDERKDAGVPDAWGCACTATSPLGCGLDGAVRAGWASDAVGFSEKHVSAMLRYTFNQGAEAVGIGAAWDDVWGGLNEDQYTVEAFLRAQFARNLALTPSLQYIRNPASSPAVEEAWLLGLRLRLTF